MTREREVWTHGVVDGLIARKEPYVPFTWVYEQYAWIKGYRIGRGIRVAVVLAMMILALGLVGRLDAEALGVVGR